MLSNIIYILFILFISLEIQKIMKIPAPVSTIILTVVLGFIFPDFMAFTTLEVFSEEMLVFIVLLVLVDAFVLKLSEIKNNWVSLSYLAGVSVALSVLAGVAMSNTIFSQYNLSVGSIIALFSMCLATDPVSVVATFKQYKIPHQLKLLAEGESLFNDAVALIMFSAFGLYLMKGNELTASYAVIVSFEIIVLSTLIGLIIGVIGISLLKTTKDLLSELVLILLIAYGAFFFAEHMSVIGGNHLSGLLSEIVAILTMTSIIDKSHKYEKRRIERNTNSIIYEIENNIGRKQKTSKKLVESFVTDISNLQNQQAISNFLEMLAMFINAILFISLAKLIVLDDLILYWKEILMMFLTTTIIRFFMMGKFAFVSNKVNKKYTINFRWWSVLSFAGIKGGLSIVMLHMLNLTFPNFEHKAMFESIVIGVILLSLFIYVIGLMITIGTNKEKFEIEYLEEKQK